MPSQDEETNLTVPKFGSFRSKFAGSHPTSREGDRSKDARASSTQRDHHSEKHRRRERPRREDHERHHQGQGSRSHDIKETPNQKSEDRVRPDNFLIDTRGDPLIRRYGGLDRSQIVSYRRYGAGRVLGTPGWLVIHRDGPRETFSIRRPGEGSHLYKDKDGLRSRNFRLKSHPVRLRPKDDASLEDIADGFIPLESSKKRKHGQQDSESSDEEEMPYRSIEGTSKAAKYDKEDSDGDSDASDNVVVTDQDNPVRWRSMQLTRQVKETPDDTNAWLQLVDHQDTLLRANEAIDRKAFENEAHSYAEIKVSMLESALSHASHPEDHTRVLVRLMREGVKVWSTKVAARRWAEVSAEEQRSFEMWKTHLNFLISNIANFHYDDVKKFAVDRLRYLLSQMKAAPHSEGFRELIYVFSRVTRLIHDAGYKELAVAAWQGILEANLFRPELNDNDAENLISFQEFWESEVPRLGDEKALGWKHYVESGGEGEAFEAVNDSTGNSVPSRDSYKAWGYAEHFQAERATLPARTLDEGIEDDPFRVVVYSDIEPLLFIIPSSILLEISEQLIDAFLLFCGYPPAYASCSWTEAALHDQYLVGSRVDMQMTPKKSVSEEGSEEIQDKSPSFDAGDLRAAISPELLFPGNNWFRYVSDRKADRAVGGSWLRNAMRQLVQGSRLEQLAPFYLAVCLSEEPHGVKKQAKALLKQYPTNMQIYNAYALAEFANGNVDISSKVLTSATGLATTSSKDYQMLLWKSSAMLELELGNLTAAAWKLTKAVDEQVRKSTENTSDDNLPLSVTQVLKTQQSFALAFDQLLATGNLDGASLYAQCMALYAYLTAEGCTEPRSMSQGNISAAMLAIDSASNEMRKRGHVKSASHERVLQFSAKLLSVNASKGPFRRIYVRQRLFGYVSMFPQNTIFLSLFEWADSGLRVVDETRDLLGDKVLVSAEDCVSSRLFSIHHEMRRGNINTIRTAFEQALTSDRCDSAPGLWISYIRFCSSQKELRAKTKDVFYRALRRCPWSKEVMMEAFVTLAQEMDSDELRAVYNTMASKGLRIHVDLEEFLQQRRAAGSHRGGDARRANN